MAYPRALRPNHALDRVNVFALNLGKPKVADTDWIVVDRAMANAAFVLAHSNSGDSPACARNITVKATQAGGSDDTPGKVTVVGKNVKGDTITEDITPLNGSTVAGLKAFASVTSVTQSGWTAGGTADRIEVGFGALIGMPALTGNEGDRWAAQIEAGSVTVFGGYLDATPQAPTIAHASANLEDVTFDLSAGTYNGSKTVHVLIAQ